MYRTDAGLRFSPTDLTVYLDSEFASWMDRWHAERRPTIVASGNDNGKGSDPPRGFAGPFPAVPECQQDAEDPELRLVARKGDEHEKAFLQSLKQSGLEVVEIPRDDTAVAATLAAMRGGAPIIFQGHLGRDGWAGYADFLARQVGPSTLGDHHYEVWDTKLARSPKPYFLVQLCAYADMLEHAQGVRPRFVEVVLGNGERRRFVTNQFFYYYRELSRAFLRYHENFDETKLPDPGLSTSHGRWSDYAEQLLSNLDHLSRVARITRGQIRKLEDGAIATMTQLSKTGETQVRGLAPDVLTRLRAQARLQLESRNKDRPLFEMVPPAAEDPRRGLALLPPDSANDVFFDLEGYPLIEGGLEYLFGAVHVADGKPQFVDWWAHDAIGEKQAFEQFIDWAFARWKQDPSMHIYHYAAYEVSAMRRLMGRYATRENEVDHFLRNGVFVDLYTVVRQGVLVGTPSYSLKDVERVYLPKRDGRVTTAGGSVVAYQRWLDEQGGVDGQRSKILAEIRDYNRVDCESLFHLANWLRTLQETAGIGHIAAPTGEAEDATDGDTSAKETPPAKALGARLLTEVVEGHVGDAERRRVQELLAWLLEFHWREAKPLFWRKFDRHDMTESELVEDLDCLGALQRTEKPRQPVKRSWDYEYRFDPDQDTKLHDGSDCFFAHDLNRTCTVTYFDAERGLLTIKLGPKVPEPPQRLSLIPDEYVRADVIANAVYRYVEAWAEGRVLSRAVDDLLHRRAPRVHGGRPGSLVGNAVALADVVRVASNLDATTLSIQGPPGAGKTFTAAAIIVGLLKAKKRVGITATSHEAINNALRAVADASQESGFRAKLIKVGGNGENDLFRSGRVTHLGGNGDAATALTPGPLVMGGTAWLFSREEMAEQFDYLIVDEAGQFSLANAVATGQASKNLILVGDQMQLAQPIQGSHPGESGMSALEYLLQDHATVPPELGVFLGTSWRMHPHICQFISEAVYDGRLQSHPDTQRQEVRCPAGTNGDMRRTSGIVHVEVEHQFNSQYSDEEVDAIELIVQQLLGRCVVGRDGNTHDLTLDDILVVAPYNMQVRRLKQRLGPAARVGSVDKFQGQEAAVVIVSMCASSAEESPRGIDFLLNKNRMNVAVSRAKCLAIVVGSRSLMSARCATIAHMEMTNLYCWLAAHAEQPLAT
jgi:uncharacterized protein